MDRSSSTWQNKVQQLQEVINQCEVVDKTYRFVEEFDGDIIMAVENQISDCSDAVGNHHFFKRINKIYKFLLFRRLQSQILRKHHHSKND